MKIALKDKIWGSFAGLAIGDAMGMPFHELTPEEIRARCGGLVTTFFEIFDDEFIHIDFKKGQITDDTTLTIVTARAILKYGRQISSEQFVQELAHWVKNNQDVWQHGNVYGPSTKAAFINYINGKFDAHLNQKRSWCYTGTSNGSIMRVSPAGWAYPGRWQEAVELACNVILPTHPTDVALSAAAGQAAAISQALTPGATISSVIDAALAGVKLGEDFGKKLARQTSQRYPLPNLELALDLAEKAKDPFEASNLIRRSIGSHFHASETLSTAFGIFYAAKGDPKSSIIAAVNNGSDSDTIASIVGALTGALHGISALPKDWVNTVEDVNHLHCAQLAEEFAALPDAEFKIK
ncbi:MAG: ADP-ribosylglycohydrolase family protein [Anaerolineae bacterium]|nr:ADP-ribosylglycohydrolase family protein [Anaerolineae bacterium]